MEGQERWRYHVCSLGHITSHALRSMHNRRHSKERCRQPWRLHFRFNIQWHDAAVVLHALADLPTTCSAATSSATKNALEVSSIRTRPRTQIMEASHSSYDTAPALPIFTKPVTQNLPRLTICHVW